VAVDSSGVYVVGITDGALPGQTSGGGRDAFVRKYDGSGTEQWTRQFGTASDDEAYAVAVDSSGVYVAGHTFGALPGQTNAGSLDAFVRKYDAGGGELWTHQFGTASYDEAHGVAVDSSGVYVVGYTGGALPGRTNAGSLDAFVRRYDASGAERLTRQFGTASVDLASGVAVDSSGVYVAGSTYGTFPGQTNAVDADAFVMKPVLPPPDSTPPIIVPTVFPSPNAGGWNNGDVTVSWSVSDPESGIGSSSGCDTAILTDDTPGTTLTCSATNGAGLSGSASVTIRIDRTPPTITGSGAPDANSNGWNNGDVTVSFTASDGLSGLASVSDPTTLSVEGAGQWVTGTAVDVAGNTASATIDNVNIDKTPPTISGTRTPGPNPNGWNNVDITVEFACSDSLSGVDSCGPTQIVTTEGSGQSKTGTVTDRAGNSASTTVEGINIDKTAPEITINTPQQYAVLPVGTALDYEATDDLGGSGIWTLEGELDCGTTTTDVNDGYVMSQPGACTLEVEATDWAGNMQVESRTFVVYDPNGGFVSGAGVIDSPSGAYVPDTSKEGKAILAFTSKYRPGTTVPTGNTTFKFHEAGLDFKSSSYDWMVVNESYTNARFQGSGTIGGQMDPNGNPYLFMVWATDGTPDTFRIKIWWEDAAGEHLVYDNGANQTIDGSIVIHR
ncbi:MAG: SBBP repeat-containing protein, partial [Chloroflexi bacterium]|nr:SBBP repeat-containing protein [Chloroflexota bacterium]